MRTSSPAPQSSTPTTQAGEPADGGHSTSAYTGAHPTLAGRQAQSLAYSLDEGQTWTKYSGNPVLDIGSREFRDPKVFWYAPAKEWRMVVVRSVERGADIYGSPNLKDWTHLSEFGPAGAVGGSGNALTCSRWRWTATPPM